MHQSILCNEKHQANDLKTDCLSVRQTNSLDVAMLVSTFIQMEKCFDNTEKKKHLGNNQRHSLLQLSPHIKLGQVTLIRTTYPANETVRH